MSLDARCHQVLAVAFGAGEAAAGQFHGFGYGEPFFERLACFGLILRIESFRPPDMLALGGGQLLAGLGLLQDAPAVVLG